MDGQLEIPENARRYPGRHEVVDGVLVRGDERIEVVVKKTRTGFRQRLAGVTRAERSDRVARALLASGLSTPEPLGVDVQPSQSWFVARRLPDAVQVRAWFRHRADPAGVPPPPLPVPLADVVTELGRLARRLHDAGIFFRDFTDGNVLVTARPLRLWLVDLDRARLTGRPLGLLRRMRDLARPGLDRREDHERLLASYFEPGPVPRGALTMLRGLRKRIVWWDDLKKRLRPWRA